MGNWSSRFKSTYPIVMLAQWKWSDAMIFAEMMSAWADQPIIM